MGFNVSPAENNHGIFFFLILSHTEGVGSALGKHGSGSNAVIVSLPEDGVTRDGSGIRGRSHGVGYCMRRT